MATAPLVLPDAAVGSVGTPIDTLLPLRSVEGGPGPALRKARELAGALRSELLTTGQPDSVRTHDLVSLPYPTKFGLWRAALSPSPFLTITNRVVVVRWTDSAGATKVLVWEPSDVELDANTPYFVQLQAKMPAKARSLTVTEHGTVADALAKEGLSPGDVDYIAFDHLHTQDVRRWVGTTKPQADISPDKPVEAFFPRARLIVQRRELLAMADLHPLQQPWYLAHTYVDIAPERLAPIDGSILLGPGIALVETPGHVVGNQSLVLSTSTGVWATSENAIAAECLSPEHSKIPGVARWAKKWQQEVILNANTIEATGEQYNSMVIEKTLVDPSQRDGRFLQFFPSSELTSHWSSPGTSPTFVHGSMTHC